MAHLLDLHSRPLTWSTLRQRLEAYYAAHERVCVIDPAPAPRARSGNCLVSNHRQCKGMGIALGPRFVCSCDCHEVAS